MPSTAPRRRPNERILGRIAFVSALVALTTQNGEDQVEICKQQRWHEIRDSTESHTCFSRDLLIDIYTQQGHLGDAGRLKVLNSNLV